MNFLDTLENLVNQTAFMSLTVGNYIMIVVACVFLYLAIKKGYEPLLLVPIAFGMLLDFPIFHSLKMEMWMVCTSM